MDHTELTIPQLARVLWRKKYILGMVALVTAVGGYLIARQLPETYTSRGLLVVEPRQISISELGAGLNGSAGDLIRTQTEAQVLRSRALAEGVARDLRLADNPLFMKPDEWSPIDAAKTFILSLLPSDETGDGVPIDRNAIAANIVQANLDVAASDKSAAITVEYTAEDPGLAAAIVNRVMEIYMAGQVRSKSEVTQHVNEVLSGRVERLWQEVADADRRVQEFRAANGLLETNGGDINALALADLQSKLDTARGQVTSLEASVQSATRALETGGVDASAEVLASPLIQGLRQQEAQVARNLSSMSERLGPRHPQIRAVTEELANVRSQIAGEIRKIWQSLRRDLTIAQAQVQGLEQRIAAVQARAQAAAGKDVELQQLIKEAEAKRVIYQSYMARVEQTAAGETGPLPDVRIASAAVVPIKPSGPNKKAIAAFAGMAGLSLAGAGVLLRDATRGRVFSGDELAKLTHFPAFGTIPVVRGRRHGSSRLPDAVVTAPQLDAAESVRGLWAGLRSARQGWTPKVVMVTSSVPGEGKTSLVTALGRVAALDGARVLLIDADFRMPTVGSFLRQEPGEYVDELLAENEPPEAALRIDHQTGMMYLPASGRVKNPQAVLTSQQMAMLLQDARANFDLVLIDTPPVLRVSDPVMLAAHADAILFVGAWAQTHRNTAAAAARRLKVPSHVLIGSVLSRVGRKAGTHDYYAGYHRNRKALPAPRPANADGGEVYAARSSG